MHQIKSIVLIEVDSTSSSTEIVKMFLFKMDSNSIN